MGKSDSFLAGFAGFLLAGFVIFHLYGPVVILERVESIEEKDLIHPSLEMLESFLRYDYTDLLERTVPRPSHSLICVDYAITLRANAVKRGYDLDVVFMNFKEGGGHAICGAKLMTGEYVWIEPQLDLIMSPKRIGDTYVLGEKVLGTIEYIGIID